MSKNIRIILILVIISSSLYSNLSKEYILPQVKDNTELCFERAFRAYSDALIFQEYNFFTSICSSRLKKLNSHNSISLKQVKDVLKEDYAELIDYSLSSYEIEWDNMKVLDKNSRTATVDVILIYNHEEKIPIISHMSLSVELNANCNIVSATYQLINSF